MTISAISAAGLEQSVVSSSNSTQLQQALQALQHSLTAGDLSGANSAFQTLQKLISGLTNASGNSSANSTQLSSDFAALGSALGAGDLASAQSAFTVIQKELASAGSPSLAVEANAASASEQLVESLLSPLNTSNGSTDSTASLLGDIYGSGLNIHA